jgi:hypothetical protein
MAKMLEGSTANILQKMEAQQEQLALENESRRKNWIPKHLRDKPDDWYSESRLMLSLVNVISRII